MTTFFNATQRRILTYVWIPVIVYLLCYLASDVHIKDFAAKYKFGEKQNTDYIGSIILLFPFMIMVGYEFVIRQKYREMLLMMLAALGVNALIMLEFYFRTKDTVPGYGITPLLTSMMANFLLLLLRAYLLGYSQVLRHALIALAITYSTSNLSANIYSMTNPFYGLDFWWREVISLPFRALLPFLYFAGLLLADNLATDNTYLEKLRSKVQVIDSLEYFVLYFFLINVAFFGAIALGWNVSTLYNKIFGHNGPETQYFSGIVVVFFSVIYGAVCFAAGYLLRNITLGRMMTIGSDNGWMFVLHFSFLLNIIPMISWTQADAVHKTEEENASFYLTKTPSSVGVVMIVLGALCSFMAGCYIMLAIGKSGFVVVFAIAIAFIFFINAIMHLMLRGFKTAVYWVVSLNIAAMLIFGCLEAGPGSYVGVMCMNIYLSFFIMMEIFHPSLDKYQLDVDTIPEGIPAE